MPSKFQVKLEGLPSSSDDLLVAVSQAVQAPHLYHRHLMLKPRTFNTKREHIEVKILTSPFWNFFRTCINPFISPNLHILNLNLYIKSLQVKSSALHGAELGFRVSVIEVAWLRGEGVGRGLDRRFQVFSGSCSGFFSGSFQDSPAELCFALSLSLSLSPCVSLICLVSKYRSI